VEVGHIEQFVSALSDVLESCRVNRSNSFGHVNAPFTTAALITQIWATPLLLAYKSELISASILAR
jgi:hypothetical protein